MEENNIISNPEEQVNLQNGAQNELYEQSKAYVKETGKWLHFLAILSTIGIVFMVLAGIFCMCCSSFMSMYNTEEMPSFIYIIIGVLYIIIAGIMVFPVIYMFRASSAARQAVALHSNFHVVEFLKNCKSYWKFMGIYTIVCLALCLLIIIAAIIIGVAVAASI